MNEPPDQRYSALVSLLARGGDIADQLIQNVTVVRIAKTRNSELLRIQAKDFDTPILAKIIAVGDSRNQFKSLEYAHQSMSHTTFTVPQPLFYDVNSNILLMQYISGTTVSNILENAQVTFYQKSECVASVARWLSRFHSRTLNGIGNVEASRRLTMLMDKLSSIEKAAKADTVIDSALRFLSGECARLDKQKTPLCSTHGDCKPENFIINDASLLGIDLDVCRNGLNLIDIAQFANHIMFASLRISGYFHQSDLRQLTSNFIDQYRVGDLELDYSLLKWLRILHYTGHWATEIKRGTLIGRLQATLLKRLVSAELAVTN